MATHIETWGILGKFIPPDSRDLIWKSLKSGHWYYNQLVEFERGRRDDYRLARGRLCPELAALEDKYNDEDQELTKEERALLKTLRQQFEGSEDLVLVDGLLKDRVDSKTKAVRPQLYWGQYNLVEDAFKGARKAKGLGPKFRRFEGEGRVGGQVQAGARKFLNGKKDVGVLHITQDSWLGTTARVVRLRVGSLPNSDKPLWIHLPVKIHRELPEGSVIKTAWVRVRRYGGRPRYDLQLVVESETYEPRPAFDDSMVAIDIGWKLERDADGRILEGEDALLRVASCGDDQNAEHLHLPWKNCGAKYRSLKSIRDAICATERQQIWAERDALAILSEEVGSHLHHMADPDRNAGPQPGRWRSPSALAKLHRLLQGGAPDHLNEWWHRDTHLWQYEAGTRRRDMARRKDIYRNFARLLERTYSYCVIEKFKLDNVRRRKGSGAPRKPNFGRILAKPSELVSILKEVFGPDRIIEVDPRGTSRICTECRTECAGSSSVKLVCEHCGHEEDRDCRGVSNIYRRGRERLGAHKAAAATRKAEREEKQAAKRKEREKALDTRLTKAAARKSVPMAAE